MTVESHIISLNDSVTPSQVEGILRIIIGTGGQIEITSGKVIIASFDNSYADAIKQRHGVKLVGGVNFRGRKVRNIVRSVSSQD
ncbi:hypothetical protein HNV12_19005 [Methanococcoides sp. SA1]|nr:hypothetical protein [Methanococcoides sp. SA1]